MTEERPMMGIIEDYLKKVLNPREFKALWTLSQCNGVAKTPTGYRITTKGLLDAQVKLEKNGDRWSSEMIRILAKSAMNKISKDSNIVDFKM